MCNYSPPSIKMGRQSKKELKDLKICHWNANGLRDKLGEMKDFMLQHKIDVMLVNETNYTNKNKNKNQYQLNK